MTSSYHGPAVVVTGGGGGPSHAKLRSGVPCCHGVRDHGGGQDGLLWRTAAINVPTQVPRPPGSDTQTCEFPITFFRPPLGPVRREKPRCAPVLWTRGGVTERESTWFLKFVYLPPSNPYDFFNRKQASGQGGASPTVERSCAVHSVSGQGVVREKVGFCPLGTKARSAGLHQTPPRLSHQCLQI